jgi:hypothetical protein
MLKISIEVDLYTTSMKINELCPKYRAYIYLYRQVLFNETTDV